MIRLFVQFVGCVCGCFVLGGAFLGVLLLLEADMRREVERGVRVYPHSGFSPEHAECKLPDELECGNSLPPTFNF